MGPVEKNKGTQIEPMKTKVRTLSAALISLTTDNPNEKKNPISAETNVVRAKNFGKLTGSVPPVQ